MKIYVTRYALTSGVLEYDAEVKGRVAVAKNEQGRVSVFRSDWHTSLDQARASAEEMRLKKIASLNKQIRKLEQLVF